MQRRVSVDTHLYIDQRVMRKKVWYFYSTESVGEYNKNRSE